ncbi:Patatin-like phospholipase [Novipirellula aureliae]|uniref:Patatin-like phospholipase n=2 Tax=Novipirellula aureliae TaxID=2527966 RepID=A0A5C6DVS9_9BACT|nr:Patatin-like phospholipase [Novipirellula aureliae]
MNGGEFPLHRRDFEQSLAKVRSGVGQQTRPVSRFASVVPSSSITSLGDDGKDASKPLVVNAAIEQVVVEPTAASELDHALASRRSAWDRESVLGELFPETKKLFDALARRRIRLAEHYNLRPHGLFGANASIENRADWAIDYFDAAQRFVDLAGELADLPPTHLAQLRSIVSEINRDELKRELITRYEGDSTEEIQQLLLTQTIAEAAYQIQRERLANSGLPRLPSGSIDVAELKSLIERECSESRAMVTLNRLKQRTVNAYHQAEYVSLMERDQEELQGFTRSGQTIAANGQVLLILESLDSELESKFKNLIRSETFRCILFQLDQKTLEQLQVEELVIDSESASVMTSLLEMLQLSDEDLVELATRCNRESEPVERHQLALSVVLRRALDASAEDRLDWLRAVGQLARPEIDEDSDDKLEKYQSTPAQRWSRDNLARGIMARFAVASNRPTEVVAVDDVVLAIKNGGVPLADIGSLRSRVMNQALWLKTHLFLVLGLLVVLFGFFVDVNANSMHSYYRNHLVNAFFVSRPRSQAGDTRSDDSANPLLARDAVLPISENGFRLTQLSPKNCAAPYLIVNGALNLQAVDDPKLRDRKCDPFFFSKRFCGSVRTGFIRSGLFEQVHRKMNLGTAMAISAAAVAPNMGRRTNGFLVFIMTLLNIRLGYWVPNPASFLRTASKGAGATGIGQTVSAEDSSGLLDSGKLSTKSFVVDWKTVFQTELDDEISPRRIAAYPESSERELRLKELTSNNDNHLTGLALSGGGIRSASFALGVLQAVSDIGVFLHIDYLSTVSGGGYTGCGLSVAMARDCVNAAMDVNGDVGNDGDKTEDNHDKVFHDERGRAYANRRLAATYYARELISNLHTEKDWSNVSDGGHIENLGAFELLRRRCRLIIISDAEADPNYQFDGLATLIRLAKLELNTEIEIKVDSIRPKWPVDQSGRPIESKTGVREYVSQSHFAIGKINYPPNETATEGQSLEATLVYLKSSITGDEELPISEYRDRHPEFPHQPTSDQFFDQDQFDAYRLLGCKIALDAFGQNESKADTRHDVFRTYQDFTAWVENARQDSTTN